MHPTPEILLECAKFRVERLVRVAPDGSRHDRQVIRHPGAVVIIPWLPDGQICLIDNYRPAIGERLIELPAGTREPGEPAEKTAARELSEETGFRAEHIERLIDFYPSPGILDERMTLYVASDLTAGPPAREPTEQIENRIVSWNEALQLIADGEIKDAKTLVGLLLWDRLRDASA